MAVFDVGKAAAWNPYYSRNTSPPWRDRFYQVAEQLGFDNWTPNAEAFAEAVYYWQRSNGLSADGILGPSSWRKMEPNTRYSMDFSAPRPNWTNRPKPAKKTTKPTAPSGPELPSEKVTRDVILGQLQDVGNMKSHQAAVMADVLLGFKLSNTAVKLGVLCDVVAPFGGVGFTFAFMAPFAATIGNLMALHRSLTSGYRVSGKIGFVYGYCAYIYGDSKPLALSTRLDSHLQNGTVEYTQHRKIQHRKYWVQNVVRGWDAAYQHRLKLKLDKFSHQAVMRYLSANDRGRLSDMIVWELAKRMKVDKEGEAFMAATRGSSPCRYPK